MDPTFSPYMHDYIGSPFRSVSNRLSGYRRTPSMFHPTSDLDASAQERIFHQQQKQMESLQKLALAERERDQYAKEMSELRRENQHLADELSKLRRLNQEMIRRGEESTTEIIEMEKRHEAELKRRDCLLYTSPSPRDS
eukprot:TRINITY_DN4782_c0_g1_i1.p1 TRINITY_DN4782_c0_g1~~TRINITY_DN4782_c0_g1_i1.p1  ORF type:complete len:139 (+),score=33.89 TRINITY_DN4782_c0_g1_i1:47-463(+)